MWYKCLLVSLIFTACNHIESDQFLQYMEIQTVLVTPKYQKEYSIIDTEIQKYFYSDQPKTNKCTLSINIQKNSSNFGLTSTAFSINKTIQLITQYHFTCTDGFKMNRTITLEDSLTLIQDKTLGLYVGEDHIDIEVAKKIASTIYNEIKLNSTLFYTKNR